MELRSRITAAMKQAMKDKAADRLSTLRLINAAIKDRDIAARGEGREDGVGDDEVLSILSKMVKQRRESAKTYEEGGRLDLAEREEAEIVRRGHGRDRRGVDPRHGSRDGRAEVEIFRPDGFRRRRPEGEGPAGGLRGMGCGALSRLIMRALPTCELRVARRAP